MIKAIETEYNGIKFKSRLEARWAVFFDTLGLTYRYKSEVFELAGVKYAPDFYIPELNIYVEVKGTTEACKKDFWRMAHFVDFNGPLNEKLMIVGAIPDYTKITFDYDKNRFSTPSFLMLYCDNGVKADEVTLVMPYDSYSTYVYSSGVNFGVNYDTAFSPKSVTPITQEVGHFVDSEFSINNNFAHIFSCDSNFDFIIHKLTKAYETASLMKF